MFRLGEKRKGKRKGEFFFLRNFVGVGVVQRVLDKAKKRFFIEKTSFVGHENINEWKLERKKRRSNIYRKQNLLVKNKIEKVGLNIIN
jgi:hypothetical protein